MDTQQAYQAYLVTAQNQSDYMNTLLWVLFTLVVIAPLLTFLVYLIYTVVTLKKCPQCGSRKNTPGYQTTQNKNKTTTKLVAVCGRCGYEF